MKSLLEIHILQNFAPSNLNRDDTGSPKDAYFGGVRRARISSQSLKRAMRQHFDTLPLLSAGDRAVRTKRVTQELIDRLVRLGRPQGEALAKVTAALGGMKLTVKFETKDGVTTHKTEYLLFLGDQELTRIAELIHARWDDLAASEGGDKKGKDAKKVAKAAVAPDLSKAMLNALDGGKAVDVALFGRMLADLPERNADAAAQVAHALGTGRMEREFDFYTAVDDLKPDDTAGADMLGTVEFTSATYYRYANLDLEQLRGNLQGDDDLALRGVEAFLRASVFAAPSGKQNTFAAHNLPDFIAFTVRREASPRNLANAFEKPVQPQGGLSLLAGSLSALGREWEKQERIFAQPGSTHYLNVKDERDVTWEEKGDGEQVVRGALPGQRVPDLESLIQSTMREVRAALGVTGGTAQAGD
ncbi:type I-E CRISPR-associated protein Cas7/Cse4/CasC [Deinococcus planocerae]|uniref:type I-E CRISPR-associated protein Cas7/Cse4/CasC n=1 Tax=Deinococcus planocerae TaxID=1737569 RepID=UPI000C7E910A|nr:type I-E CRISPR-associated protein Cas7/Cse4/CasC [Deinococcus planocerae]